MGQLGTLQERAFAYEEAAERRPPRAVARVRERRGTSPRSSSGARAERRRSPGRRPRRSRTVAQIPPSTFPDRLGFAPPPGDERFLRSIREKGGQLSEVMQRIIDFEGRPPEATTDQGREAGHRPQSARLRARERHDRAHRRRDLPERRRLRARGTSSSGRPAPVVFLGLLLGFVLSWSVIGPIQKIDTRRA